MSRFYSLEQAPLNLRSSARAIAAANNGALFDPSDLSTLYQDAAGTTPVTAVEQPVGLMLDKSQGLMLGPELWSNPSSVSVTNGTGYYTKGTKTITGQTLYPRFGFNLNLIVGKRYVISGKLSGNISNILEIQTTNDTAPSQCKCAYNATTGFFYGIVEKQVLGTGDGAGLLWFRTNASAAAFSVVIDNISVRELYGNHAAQSVTASRPTLSARKNILLATEALATQSVTTLAATYTLSFTGAGSVALSGAATGTLTGTGTDRVSLTFTPTAGTLTLTVSGSVTKAQIELGSIAGPYQRVNTATDYDADERYFPKYLRFDGIDDYLSLPYMGLYANGSASVVVGLSTAVRGPWEFIVSEGNNANDVANYLLLTHTSMGVSRGVFGSSARSNTSVTQYALSSSTISTDNPSNVVTVVDGGSGVNLFNNSIGIGAVSYARSSATTLNTTTIGALDRITDTGFMTNNLYSLIITKSALTDAQRVRCERYAASKAGVIL